jgi:hypothetical protein
MPEIKSRQKTKWMKKLTISWEPKQTSEDMGGSLHTIDNIKKYNNLDRW